MSLQKRKATLTMMNEKIQLEKVVELLLTENMQA